MSSKEMRYRPLGRSGAKVSELSLGGWTTFGGSVDAQAEVDGILAAAYDAGINFFDIADVYARGEAERVMGKALARHPRRNLVISSKVYFPMSDEVNDRGLSRKHIVESIDASLKRVGTDYLDIYFCHRYDNDTPLEETARAMDDLVRQGKILYWGTSEWTGSQLSAAHALADKRNLYGPRVEQPQYNLLERAKVEGDVQPAAERFGMGLVVWSPLASGLLTGKYDEGVPEGSRLAQIDWLRDLRTDEAVARVKKLKGIADKLGCTRAQLALAWTAAQKGISSVITGATKKAQLEENLGAMKIKLTDEILKEIDAICPRA